MEEGVDPKNQKTPPTEEAVGDLKTSPTEWSRSIGHFTTSPARPGPRLAQLGEGRGRMALLGCCRHHRLAKS